MSRQIPLSNPIGNARRHPKECNSFIAGCYKKLFSTADIIPNGIRPWDIQIHDPRFYKRILLHGSVGLGESYMENWWDVRQLDEFFTRILHARLDEKAVNFPRMMTLLEATIKNLQSITRSREVGEQHYDIGNRFYAAMLDPQMVYTCAYWRHTDNMPQAQLDKLDLVCRKMGLVPGMKVLDIGCGWGSFAGFAAQHYGVAVVGVTISKEQAVLARARCAGLKGRNPLTRLS